MREGKLDLSLLGNKTLSENICDKCGIKPYYGLWVNFGDLDNNYELITNKRKYRLIADLRNFNYVDDDELRNLESEYLPDFENNYKNFVELFELDFDKIQEDTRFQSIGEFVLNCSEYATYDRKSFLENLYLYLYWSEEEGYEFREGLIDNLKTAIREHNWEINE